MGIIDKFKNFVNPNDMDGDLDDYGYDEDPIDDYAATTGNIGYEEDDFVQPQPSAQPRRQPNAGMNMNMNMNAAPMQTGNVEMSSASAMQVKIVHPDRWDNLDQIADHLINQRTVIVNFQSAKKEVARRMLDFLMGVVYTVDGGMQKAGPNLWVFTPNNVSLTNEEKKKVQQQKNSINFEEYED